MAQLSPSPYQSQLYSTPSMSFQSIGSFTQLGGLGLGGVGVGGAGGPGEGGGGLSPQKLGLGLPCEAQITSLIHGN